MPDLKISQLNNGDPAQTADQIPINRAGVNFSVTAGSIASLATTNSSNTEVLFNNAGVVDGDPQFTFNPTGDILSLTGQFNIDNLRIDGNTISTTTTNGNLSLVPDGTGQVDITKVNIDSGTIDGTDIGTGVAALGIFTRLDVDNLQLDANAITSTNTNGNITLAPNGTGHVFVDADTLRVGDANVAAILTTNGTGNLTISTNNGTNSGTILITQGVNGAINITPNGTGRTTVTNLTTTSPRIVTGINDTNGNELFLFTATASAVNELTYANAATTGTPTFTASGSDTNIGVRIASKGTGQVQEGYASAFWALASEYDVGSDPNDVPLNQYLGTLAFQDATSVSITLAAFGAGTVTAPSITTNGDVDTGIYFPAANTVSVTAGGAEQFRVATTASAVNYVQVTGAATGGYSVISAQGSDTNTGLIFQTKGTAYHRFSTGGSSTNEQLRVLHTASTANRFEITGAAAGASPVFSVAGSDTNIGISLQAKGTGSVLVTVGNGLGYGTGTGGAQTQATSRTTGVTLDKPNGAITLFSAAGDAVNWTSFTVTNNTVAATDTVVVSQKSGTDKYTIFVTAVSAGSFELTFRTTGGTTTEQPVFNFAVIKAVTS